MHIFKISCSWLNSSRKIFHRQPTRQLDIRALNDNYWRSLLEWSNDMSFSIGIRLKISFVMISHSDDSVDSDSCVSVEIQIDFRLQQNVSRTSAKFNENIKVILSSFGCTAEKRSMSTDVTISITSEDVCRMCSLLIKTHRFVVKSDFSRKFGDCRLIEEKSPRSCWVISDLRALANWYAMKSEM